MPHPPGSHRLLTRQVLASGDGVERMVVWCSRNLEQSDAVAVGAYDFGLLLAAQSDGFQPGMRELRVPYSAASARLATIV